MFSLKLSEEQQSILDTARDFSRKEMLPKASHFDETMEYPWEIVKKAHAAGLLNLSLKEEHGGLGLGSLLQIRRVRLEHGHEFGTWPGRGDAHLGALILALGHDFDGDAVAPFDLAEIGALVVEHVDRRFLAGEQ